MPKRIIYALILTVLLCGALTVFLMIKSSPAFTETSPIYIYSNGSVNPPWAPISVNGNVFTLTANVVSGLSSSSAVIIQRNNTVLDGGGHTIHGTGSNSSGVYLNGLSNVTIRNMSISSFSSGIYESGCFNGSVSQTNLFGDGYGVQIWSGGYNVISGNNITANTVSGVWLYCTSYNNVGTSTVGNSIWSNFDGVGLCWDSFDNCVVGNNLTSNDYGVYVYDSWSNYVFHNDLVSNVLNAYVNWDMGGTEQGNYWDNGYPSGGNYWSDYQSKYPGASQIDSSGIWNTPYAVDSAQADNYPLMKPWAPPVQVTFDQTGAGSDFAGPVVNVDGLNYTFAQLPVSFSWTPGSNHTFAYWSPLVVTQNGKQYVLASVNASSPYAVSGSATVTADYNTQSFVTLTVSVSGHGGTNATGTSTQYQFSNVSVLAIPDSGYVLSYWLLNGSYVGSANPFTVNMTGNWGLAAVFSSAVHLSLSVDPNQVSYTEDESVTLDVTVINEAGSYVNSTLTLTITGPDGYFDFQTINVTANSVCEYSFMWSVPSVAGTYVVEVSLVPPQLTAYDAAWLKVV